MEYEVNQWQLRRWFGHIAMTVLVTLLLTQFAAAGAAVLWRQVMGGITYTQAIVLNDLCVYPLTLLAFWLLLRNMPRLEPLPQTGLGAQEGCCAVFFSLGTGYLLGLVNSGLLQLLERVTGQTTGNVVSELVRDLPPGVMLVTFVVVAPLAEEYLFRRVLLERTRFLGDGAAMLINGAAFALFHGNLNQTLYAFGLGAVFAAVVLMTGRIRYTIGLHVIINLCSTLPVLLPQEWLTALLGAVVLGSITFAVVLFCVRWRRYTLEPGPLPFTGQEKARACFASPWTWVLLAGGLGFAAWTAFL